MQKLDTSKWKKLERRLWEKFWKSYFSTMCHLVDTVLNPPFHESMPRIVAYTKWKTSAGKVKTASLETQMHAGKWARALYFWGIFDSKWFRAKWKRRKNEGFDFFVYKGHSPWHTRYDMNGIWMEFYMVMEWAEQTSTIGFRFTGLTMRTSSFILSTWGRRTPESTNARYYTSLFSVTNSKNLDCLIY
jgi:hypothetical protein